MTASRQKAVPMCIVSISFNDYLMPADEGMRLVKLMQSAIECRRDYEAHVRVWAVGESPDVSYQAVKPDQLRTPSGAVTTHPGSLRLLTKS